MADPGLLYLAPTYILGLRNLLPPGYGGSRHSRLHQGTAPISTDIDTSKAELRKQAFAARKLAHAQDLDAAANAHLTQALMARDETVIAGYMPIRTEISPLETMRALHMAGRSIAVPVILGEARPLAFHLWTPDCTLKPGPFGAQIPQEEEVVIPDLLICPLVGFDAKLTRLGYGGGFYDRSLTEIRAKKPALAFGFAYGVQELPSLPRGPFDVPLDGVITEQGPF